MRHMQYAIYIYTYKPEDECMNLCRSLSLSCAAYAWRDMGLHILMQMMMYILYIRHAPLLYTSIQTTSVAPPCVSFRLACSCHKSISHNEKTRRCYVQYIRKGMDLRCDARRVMLACLKRPAKDETRRGQSQYCSTTSNFV